MSSSCTKLADFSYKPYRRPIGADRNEIELQTNYRPLDYCLLLESRRVKIGRYSPDLEMRMWKNGGSTGGMQRGPMGYMYGYYPTP